MPNSDEIEVTDELLAVGYDAYSEVVEIEPGEENIKEGIALAFKAMLKTAQRVGALKSTCAVTPEMAKAGAAVIANYYGDFRDEDGYLARLVFEAMVEVQPCNQE